MSKFINMICSIDCFLKNLKNVCCSNRQLNDFEKIYLNYMFKERGKLTFIQFLIPVNLAVYAAIYSINKGDIFIFEGTSFLLLLFLMVLNISIAIIYLREHNLDERIKTFFKDGFILKEGKISNELREQVIHFEKEDLRDKTGTWRAIKGIFSLICAIPIVLILMRVLYFLSENDSLNAIITGLLKNCYLWFIIFVFMLLVLIYLIANSQEFKKTEQKRDNGKKGTIKKNMIAWQENCLDNVGGYEK